MSRAIWLEKIDNYDIKELQNRFEHCFFDLDLKKLFKPKMKVLIKVCLPISTSKDSAETTHPAVVGALVNVLSSLGVQCIVADSPYKKYSVENLDQVYLNTGMLEVANLTKCTLNMNLKTCKKQLNDGVATKSVTLLDIINDVDAIINVGKIKIDNNLGYLGATANLFGFIPGEKKTQVLNGLNTIADFNNYLLDLMTLVQDKLILNVLDGIVALEKDKTPRMLYCLGVSESAFYLDEAIINILSINKENSIINQAKQRGFIKDESTYKAVNCHVDEFKLTDFAKPELTIGSKIHKNASSQKSYFKKHQARPEIEGNKCKGCSICSRVCPTKAIMMKYDKNGELYAKIDYKKCIFCNKCIAACPYAVVKLHTPSKYSELEKEINKFNME